MNSLSDSELTEKIVEKAKSSLFLNTQNLIRDPTIPTRYMFNVNWLSYLTISMISSGAFTIWPGDACSNFSLG